MRMSEFEIKGSLNGKICVRLILYVTPSDLAGSIVTIHT